MNCRHKKYVIEGHDANGNKIIEEDCIDVACSFNRAFLNVKEITITEIKSTKK